jgi:predicted enzyme related to lactoylglutathione lyase
MSFKPESPAIWNEIPVKDLEAAKKFYEAVFEYAMELQNFGPNPMMVIEPGEKGVGMHLYPGKPAGDGSGPTIHLQISGDLEAAVDRVWEAGGKVLDIPPVTIPEGRFVYALDPDGNSLGLFEPKRAA